jgi:type III secretion system YscQ/HrcQ family protein
VTAPVDSPQSAAVRPFPWERLPRVERSALDARRELLDRVASALDLGLVPEALAQLIGDDVSILVGSFSERRAVPEPVTTALGVQFSACGLRLSLRPEPDLTRACVARLLEQDFELGWADTGIDAALSGAGAALALEVARRAARADAPELVTAPGLAGDWVLEGQITLRLGAKPYRLHVEAESLLGARRVAGSPSVHLAALGAVRLSVPWVAAVSSSSLESLERLEPGDVWLPGPHAWVAGEPPLSAGLLAPARSEFGMAVRVAGGRTVLGAEAVSLHEDRESSMSQEESELSQIVGETPLVVRLEVGTLEMSASEWAALRPGDVIQSGRRLDEPVVLRAAGREIARGELVDVEGELGVRITQVGPSRVSP